MKGAHAHRTGPLAGSARPPGDKSISHRALMLAAMAVGETRIEGLLESEDVRATAAALAACGVSVARAEAGVWRVAGVGTGGLTSPSTVLDFGNSGTGVRLLMGMFASQPITATMTGDDSLRARPMDRVITPLAAIGARVAAFEGGRLPLTIEGSEDPLAIGYELPVASAQVKSAILLAGLNIPGETAVIEPAATRDHTERMLAAMGAKLGVDALSGGRRRITLIGEAELSPVARMTVPGDISSAAFPLVAAAIAPGSHLRLEGVGVNPLRTGLLDVLAQMGAPVRLGNARESAGEPVADLEIEGPDHLAAIDLDPALVPRMIDEFPILFVAAACAAGVSRFRGLAELRVKESDRLKAMAEGLAACGVRVAETDDGLVVHGTGHPPEGGASIAARLDHRIAMSFLVLGTTTKAPVGVDDIGPVATSFPGFAAMMARLGAHIGAG